jgi:hypothetical protein
MRLHLLLISTFDRLYVGTFLSCRFR